MSLYKHMQRKVRSWDFCLIVKLTLSSLVIDVLNANNQDPDVCHNLGPLLEDNRFTSINFVKKVVSLSKVDTTTITK